VRQMQRRRKGTACVIKTTPLLDSEFDKVAACCSYSDKLQVRMYEVNDRLVTDRITASGRTRLTEY
jgi:hypothetical protein